MAAAQLLTLTHGVDDKVTRIDDEVKGVGVIVNDIGDTVRVAHNGARYVIFRTESLLNVCSARWKGNKSNRTTYGKQRQRSDEYVVQ